MSTYYATKNYVVSFSSNIECSVYVKQLLNEGDVVLVKGSRGMKTEEIIKACLEK